MEDHKVYSFLFDRSNQTDKNKALAHMLDAFCFSRECGKDSGCPFYKDDPNPCALNNLHNILTESLK